MDKRLDGPHAQTPAGPQAGKSPSSEDAGFPWAKVLVGCGCLTLLAVVVLGVAGYFVWSKGAEYAEDSDFGEILKTVESPSADGQAGGGDRPRAEAAKEAVKEAKKRKEDALDPQKIRTYVNKPLSRADVDQYVEFVGQWHQNPAYKDWVEQYKDVNTRTGQADHDDDSVVGNLKAVGKSLKWMRTANAVTKAYDKKIRQADGGYEAYFGRRMRIGGVIAASSTIAKSNDKLEDPNSDAVAAQMLAERPKIAKQYEKNFKEAKQAAAEAKQRQQDGQQAKPANQMALASLMSMFQGPGTLALARMPEASFETWKALSVDRRQQLRESLTDTIAPGPWFGLFSLRPGALLSTAYMAELDDLNADDNTAD